MRQLVWIVALAVLVAGILAGVPSGLHPSAQTLAIGVNQINLHGPAALTGPDWVIAGTVVPAATRTVSLTDYGSNTTLMQATSGQSGQYIVYTPSLTPAATPAAIGTTQQTFTVTGLLTTDKIVDVTSPVPTSLCPMVSFRISAANTLQMDFTTLTAAACTPASGTYTVHTIR